MDFGFFRIACITPELRVADCDFNTERIIENIKKAVEKGARLIVFPELSISSYTCSDLFLQDALLTSCIENLEKIAEATSGNDALVFVGLPLYVESSLFNVAAAVQNGKVLAMIPKTFIPNYCEFYEKRHFAGSLSENCRKTREVFVSEKIGKIPFGTDILFSDSSNKKIKIGCEICEDLWVPFSPSTKAVLNGATIIANLSAGNEVIGKDSYRRNLVSMQSAKSICVYAYANAGNDESTNDVVFSGHSLIAENGSILNESSLFEKGMIIADCDLEKIINERRKTVTFSDNGAFIQGENSYREIELNFKSHTCPETLLRKIHRHPFVPDNNAERNERCEKVIELQAQGLAKRLRHTKSKTSVIGLSGGLDSTLALLVTEKAFEICGLEKSGIIAVTMPCFGTTDRTYNNACTLAKEIGCTLKEIRIEKSVRQHFEDIGHDENIHDVTYENSQARERTQILMDIANKNGGLVIGTGDLSEQALGWATYNGDHMSMYGVNGSIPKTLVRYLVQYFADLKSSDTLKDILATPVSPELLPPDGNKISQVTEDLVGPYELHDFFLYYVLRFGFSPEKIFFFAKTAFKDAYSDEIIMKWLKNFYRRFFIQQFKRSCMPDGAKVGTVNLSPRGDWRMPSDASSSIWLSELENLKGE